MILCMLHQIKIIMEELELTGEERYSKFHSNSSNFYSDMSLYTFKI